MTREQHNGRMAVQIEDALQCAAELAKHGILLEKIEIGVIAKPRITIKRPPKRARLTSGVIRVKGHATGRTETHAAPIHRCQVEWEVQA